ncbi:long-chain fatty acid--CoA ligase [Angustibacter sp. Root456]|uniref:long-chain fatty acid--CoA ligase n=1 Tax=Angustibacter sp. Root456 TaxID=1736539 RepID=UPI0007012E18|nr:long-chain fatty acid--CoA ligase [Angustibacter sp. Root456]KQX61719.1 long-chain fatty acid--CoA ligase [Angustibacter sp. Root456]
MKSTMQPVPLLISQILEYGARAHGTSEVVTWTPEGPRRSSYADVGRDCRRLANALRGLGVDADQRVATFMWNNEEHLELYLAVPSMGAVLHAINIRLFPEQLIYVANHAEDLVVVVDNSLAAPFSQLLPHLKTVRHVVVNGPVPDDVRAALGADGRTVHDYRELLDAQPDTFEWPELDENSGAAMCYTSGTTGNPKGVVYSHRSNYLHTMQVCMNSAMAMSEAQRMLSIVPLFHANAWGIPYGALMSGATLVMPDRFLQAEPLAQMIQTLGVTHSAAVPTIWNDLLQYLDSHPDADVSTLQSCIVGGSACPPALMKAFEDRYGIDVVHAWGMTETSPLGSVAVPPADSEGEERWAYRQSQGRLSPLVQGRLVGPDGREVAWDGEQVGELEVRGPWVTGSYYRDDDPAKFDGGWLRTGDVGSLSPNGYLRLTDRAKDVIKSGGEWISSVELENVLMAHPKVKEASVVGVPDERWGERPLATVVVAEGQSVDAEELRDHLAQHFAKWQLPERWAFIDEVPKTSVGKFDKKVLRKSYAEGALEVQTIG